MGATWSDLRFAIRLLRCQPGFAVVAILTLALGIGASTMLFTVAYGVLLKPLPWPDADRLMRVTETRGGKTGRVAGTLSNGTFLAWRDHPSTIEDLGGWLTQTATLTGAGDSVRLPIVPTTPNLLPMLRAAPLIGRLFQEGEGKADQGGVVVLSYGLWHERFGGRSEVLGQPIQLDGAPFTIVGVMPRGFVFPDREARAWTAWSVPPVVSSSGMLVGVIFRALARARPGTSPLQVATEATSRARSAPDLGVAARALFGAVEPIDVSAVPELQAITADVQPAIRLLFAAGLLLLITATANIASLQLANATTRRREIAVRASIGAGPRQVVRQLLVENLAIGVAGGALGLLLAVVLVRALPMIVPAGFPRADAVAVDMPVFLFALIVTVGAAIVCGLLPAWQSRRVNMVEMLAEDGVAAVGATARPSIARTRAAIMCGQVAIACVLLVGAVLVTRSFASLIRVDRGYDPVNVLTARLPFPREHSFQQRIQVLDRVVDRLRAVPGVTHAAYGTALPFVAFGGFTAFTMRSPWNPDTEMNVQAAQRIVTPDYFAAMRLRLVAGRTLTDADTATTPPAIVVNRTFARQYLGDRPLGIRIPQRGRRAGGIRFADENADWEVVGVVEDMRQEAESPLQPEIFASTRQITTRTTNVNLDPILVVRTADTPTRYASTLRRLVHEEAPALALDSISTMEDRVVMSLARPRLYAIALSWFGALALLITAVGLFGVLSFSVAQRTREIGVRTALGAQVHDIVALVLRQALWIVASGVGIGLAVAIAGGRVLSALLYGIDSRDTLTLVTVALLVIVAAGVAAFLPARRAATMDPLTALRSG